MKPIDQQARRRFLGRLMQWSGATALTLSGAPLWADERVIVTAIRVAGSGDNARVVFDLSAPVEHSLFTLNAPDRVVLDLKQAQMQADPVDANSGLLKGIRYAARDANDLRVVLDLSNAAAPKSFMLVPQGSAGHRLVIDLNASGVQKAVPVITASVNESRLRDVVVAIDAGHGGKDPGAVGKRGTREKDIVLSIARKLKARIDSQPGMQAVLIRDGDYYLKLQERVSRAARADADMFISVHADASPNRRARGSSVYVLSRNGATSKEAALLAEAENKALGVPFAGLDLAAIANNDPVLAEVIVDLGKTATMEASVDLASVMLNELDSVGNVRSRRVERAGFAVLKSLNIPSVLVETAFISNPSEEKTLRTRQHQDKLASALLSGVKGYFNHNPVPGSRLAQLGSTRSS